MRKHNNLCNNSVLVFLSLFSCNFDDQFSQNFHRFFILYLDTLLSPNYQALQELTNILDKSAKDETRVLLLTGSGNVFCSGLDLQMLVTTDHKKKVARKLAEALRSGRDLCLCFIFSVNKFEVFL